MQKNLWGGKEWRTSYFILALDVGISSLVTFKILYGGEQKPQFEKWEILMGWNSVCATFGYSEWTKFGWITGALKKSG